MSYTPTHINDGDVLTAAWINGELDNIASEYNSYDGANLQAGSVTNAKLASEKAYFALQFSYTGTIGTSSLITTIRKGIVVPCACTLVSVKMICTNRTGTADPTLDIYEQSGTPATILSSAITVNKDLTNDPSAANISGTPATTAFSENDNLTMRVTTDSDGSIVDPEVTLLFKANHVG